MKMNIRDVKSGRFKINKQLQKSLIQLIDEDLVANSDFIIVIEGDKFDTNLLLRINFRGKVKSVCDRCLESFSLIIEDNSTLMLSKDPKIVEHEHSDFEEVILIHDDDIEIDLTSHINQSINLALPMKRIHPVGARCKKFSQDTHNTKSLSENKELQKLKQLLSKK